KLFGKSYEGHLVQTSKDFCDILLQKFYVATVPGSECGTEGFMRLSFAVSEETMKKAVGRMKELVAQLK
ncbi:MAG: aminotransferase class I/II-fold pyridoxal phosphate-dependent enzyme, partial [Bdellovibrio sp.]